MAISNELKVSMCYSSTEAKRICEGFINDESKALNKTISVIREEHLLHDILPADKNARNWFKQLYIGDAKIGDVMQNVFGYLAAGINWKAAQTDGTKKLVEYAYTELQNMSGGLENYEAESTYFFGALDSILCKIDYEKKSIDDMTTKYHIEQTHRELELYIEEFKDKPEQFFNSKIYVSHVYLTILNFWEFLGDYTYTFRMLSCIASMQKWDDTPEGRVRLQNVLCDATANWKYIS